MRVYVCLCVKLNLIYSCVRQLCLCLVWPFSIGALSPSPRPIWRSGAFLPLLTVHNWNYNSIYAACRTLLCLLHFAFQLYSMHIRNCLSRAGKCCQEWKMQSQCGCSCCSCICIFGCVSLAMPAVVFAGVFASAPAQNKFDSIVRLFSCCLFYFQLLFLFFFSGLFVVKY